MLSRLYVGLVYPVLLRDLDVRVLISFQNRRKNGMDEAMMTTPSSVQDHMSNGVDLSSGITS
jgi:hypothetical protein